MTKTISEGINQTSDRDYGYSLNGTTINTGRNAAKRKRRAHSGPAKTPKGLRGKT